MNVPSFLWSPRFSRWLGGTFRRPTLGEQGEMAAARYLRRQRMKVVERRRRSRLGEIDIIAVEGRTVFFVEVKTRRSEAHGRPAEAVGAIQKARLTRAALAFLKLHGLLEVASRFDVVEVIWPHAHSKPEIRHIHNAFPAVGHRQFHH